MGAEFELKLAEEQIVVLRTSIAQLEAENERLRRYLTTREIEERMELDDLVNRLKGENNRLREYAEFVQERDLEAVFQDWLALLEGKDE